MVDYVYVSSHGMNGFIRVKSTGKDVCECFYRPLALKPNLPLPKVYVEEQNALGGNDFASLKSGRRYGSFALPLSTAKARLKKFRKGGGNRNRNNNHNNIGPRKYNNGPRKYNNNNNHGQKKRYQKKKEDYDPDFYNRPSPEYVDNLSSSDDNGSGSERSLKDLEKLDILPVDSTSSRDVAAETN
eukprot:UN31622